MGFDSLSNVLEKICQNPVVMPALPPYKENIDRCITGLIANAIYKLYMYIAI